MCDSFGEGMDGKVDGVYISHLYITQGLVFRVSIESRQYARGLVDNEIVYPWTTSFFSVFTGLFYFILSCHETVFSVLFTHFLRRFGFAACRRFRLPPGGKLFHRD